MKKAFAIFFAFFYLFSVSGISLHFHYCGGKIKKVSVFHTDEEGCCKGEMKRSAGCCKEKTTTVKTLETHDTPGSIQFLSLKNLVGELPFIFDATLFVPYVVSKEVPLCHAPPDTGDLPCYLQKRALLI